MRKKLLSLAVAVASGVFMSMNTHAANVIPYLPPLQSFGGSSVDLSTFVPSAGDYTLQVEGVIGTPISVGNGAYTYTPASNAIVRFSQKNGIVYVYEGNLYKTFLTVTPPADSNFGTITDANPFTNNLLQNASFETTGSLVGGTNYNFGSPWVTNATVASSGGIRIGTNASAVNGTYVCIWRGSGNDTYFSQPVTVKPNTYYKVVARQVAGANATAYFNFGLGATAGALDYGSNKLLLGNGLNGTYSAVFSSSPAATSAYFTVKNTNPSTSSSGTDPLTQLDYVALVEGPSAAGITGASTATYLSGTAYAPENGSIDFAGGDSYYMNTSFGTNLDMEQNSGGTLPGWTTARNVGNGWGTKSITNTTLTSKSTEVWRATSTAVDTRSSLQTITGLPNGTYKVEAAVWAVDQNATANTNTGTVSLFAGSKSTNVTIYDYESQTAQTEAAALGSALVYTLTDVAVADNSLTLGVKDNLSNANWIGFDNVKIYYTGPLLEPALAVSPTSLSFGSTSLTKTFTVSGANLTSGVTLTAPAGITLDKTSLTVTEANAGATTITATFDNATNITGGSITATSGSLTQTIAVTASADGACFVSHQPTKTNLIPDPFLNSISGFGGWGNKAVVHGAEAYCGEAAVKFSAITNAWPDGAALDVPTVAWQPNHVYKVYAKIKAVDGTFAFFAKGADPDVAIAVPMSTTGDWESFEAEFTTGPAATSNFFSFNNVDNASTGKIAYIDNWELYDMGATSSIGNTVGKPFQVIPGKAELTILSEDATAVSIYSITGQLVKKVNVSGSITIALPQGFYIVNGVKALVK